MPAWRDSYKPARFFVLDARILFLITATALWPAYYTFGSLVALAVVLFVVERRFEMSVPSAIRGVRSWVVTAFTGPLRPARPYPKQRRPIDYDRMD